MKRNGEVILTRCVEYSIIFSDALDANNHGTIFGKISVKITSERAADPNDVKTEETNMFLLSWSFMFSWYKGMKADVMAPSANILLKKNGKEIDMKYESRKGEVPNMWASVISLTSPVSLERSVAREKENVFFMKSDMENLLIFSHRLTIIQ